MDYKELNEYAALDSALKEKYMQTKLENAGWTHTMIMESIGAKPKKTIEESLKDVLVNAEAERSDKIRQKREYAGLSPRERNIYDFEKNAHPDKNHDFYMNCAKNTMALGAEVFGDSYEGNLENLQYNNLSPAMRRYYDLQKELYPNKEHEFYMNCVKIQIEIEKGLDGGGEPIGPDVWREIIKKTDDWTKRNFPNYYKKMKSTFSSALEKIDNLLKEGVKVVNNIWEWIVDLFS